MSILAFLSLLVGTKRAQTYPHDDRCRHCTSYDPHSATDHDEAIFETYRGIGEP